MTTRVRYAPSPTGLQHIGGVRTALFNWFFAKSTGGKFILRIEDTDRERYSDESLQDLFDTMDWLGLDWDEGPEKGGPYAPYIQSQRFDIYQKYARELVEKGFAYECFCTEERLESLREEQKSGKSSHQGYDRHCRDLSPEERERKREEFRAAGKTPVIRFKVPLSGSTVMEDLLFGKITRKNSDISPDPVLLKSDGFPTYHLANVIDDHLMKITHILRAQEWIPTGPLHILLYNAFGWEVPKYCHLPMVMGKDGQKLSKRHGSTSAREFRENGYLPEAIINYVTMIGWSYDDKTEFFTKDELKKVFSLEKINKAPGVFDYKKLDWFNGQYIRKLQPEELRRRLLPFLQKAKLCSDPPTAKENEILTGAVPLIRERLKKLADAPEMIRFLFEGVHLNDSASLIPKNGSVEATAGALQWLYRFTQAFFGRSDEENEAALREEAERRGVKIGDLLHPLRVAVTGTAVSPPIFETMRLLGAEPVCARVKAAADLLNAAAGDGN